MNGEVAGKDNGISNHFLELLHVSSNVGYFDKRPNQSLLGFGGLGRDNTLVGDPIYHLGDNVFVLLGAIEFQHDYPFASL